MTKKAIFTLETRDALDLLDGDDKFPFQFDCFYVTKSHYDFGDLDPRKLPDDLNPLNEPAIKEDIANLSGIKFRTRFANNTHGPYMIRIPDGVVLNREQVENIVRNWFDGGDLKEKLKEAMI